MEQIKFVSWATEFWQSLLNHPIRIFYYKLSSSPQKIFQDMEECNVLYVTPSMASPGVNTPPVAGDSGRVARWQGAGQG